MAQPVSWTTCVVIIKAENDSTHAESVHVVRTIVVCIHEIQAEVGVGCREEGKRVIHQRHRTPKVPPAPAEQRSDASRVHDDKVSSAKEPGHGDTSTPMEMQTPRCIHWLASAR
jgi:hypothetical protein